MIKPPSKIEIEIERSAGSDVSGVLDRLAAAMALAADGFPVFPLRGKVPAIEGGRGFRDATTDLEQVVAWWAGPYAGCSIGMRPPEGVVVVDVDPRDHGAVNLVGWLDGRELPAILTTTTGGEPRGLHGLVPDRPGSAAPRSRRRGAAQGS